MIVEHGEGPRPIVNGHVGMIPPEVNAVITQLSEVMRIAANTPGSSRFILERAQLFVSHITASAEDPEVRERYSEVFHNWPERIAQQVRFNRHVDNMNV